MAVVDISLPKVKIGGECNSNSGNKGGGIACNKWCGKGSGVVKVVLEAICFIDGGKTFRH